MSVELDLSRAPRGVITAAKLVKDAAEIGDLSERHYLELKGPRDLSSKKDKTKIAKFILGAANRRPDHAATAFEGCAVMIIGITADGVIGVPPVEMLELSQVIDPFLGVEGPRWDVVYVPVEGSSNVVLVVIVEPPEPGQPAFLCRANGEGVVDGRVYIRAEGETREATSAEQDLLAQRGRALSTTDVDLAVSVVGDISPVELDNSKTIEEYVDQTKSRLHAALPRPTTLPAVGIAGLAAVSSPTLAELMGSPSHEIPEDRTEEEYRAEIDDWEEAFRAAWPSAVEQLLGEVLAPMVLHLENRTDKFLEDLQVKIHLEGEVKGLNFEGYEGYLPTAATLGLPSPPRPWGPRTRPGLTIGQPPVYSSAQPHFAPALPSRMEWSNSGSVAVTLDAGDLRPLANQTFDERQLVLVLWAHKNCAPVRGTWQITARGYHHVFTGDLDVGLGEATDATLMLRSSLSLEE